MTQAILDALACGQGNCPCSSSARRGKGLTHCCSHPDKTPSLSVKEGDDGRPLVNCQAGCSQDAVIAVLKAHDLWQPLRVINGGVKSGRKMVNAYGYTDRFGKLLYNVVRYEPKDFLQQRADGKFTMDGVTRVLYRLPEVVAAVTAKERVFICEGEKDADAVVELGLVATCNSGGAGKWQDNYGADLVGGDCIVLADRDEPGRKHAEAVAKAISIGARSVRVVELPTGKDVSDWIAEGGTKEDLLAIVDRTPVRENQILTGSDLVAMYRDVIAKRMTGDTDYLEIETGLGELDKYAQYQPGDLWLVVAATGVGKSAMLSTMQMSLDDREIPSLFVSLEMSWLVVVERMLAGGVTLDQIEERVGLLVDEASLTTDKLETLAKVAKLRGARVLFVDYAQRLSGDRKDSEYERVSAISNDLARIARETRLCIVAAAQVSRQGASRDGNPPQLSEIRASGHLEQDAAVVLSLGRKPGDSLTWVAIQKNRHGQVKRFSLVFDAAHGKFEIEKSTGPASRVTDEGPDVIPF